MPRNTQHAGGADESPSRSGSAQSREGPPPAHLPVCTCPEPVASERDFADPPSGKKFESVIPVNAHVHRGCLFFHHGKKCVIGQGVLPL